MAVRGRRIGGGVLIGLGLLGSVLTLVGVVILGYLACLYCAPETPAQPFVAFGDAEVMRVYIPVLIFCAGMIGLGLWIKR